MSNSYAQGMPVVLTGEFSDRNEQPGDPTLVELLLRNGSGPEATLTYGLDPGVVRRSIGVFEYDFVPAPGEWHYRWIGSGAAGTVRGGANGTFIVQPSGFSR